MNKRGRPEKLNEGIKNQIFMLQNGREKKLKAPAIRDELRKIIETQMRKEIEDGNLNLADSQIYSEVEERLPGSSAIQKYVKKLKD